MLTGFAIAGAVLVFVHSSGLLPLAWETRDLPNEQSGWEGGLAFRVALGIDWMADADTPAPSPAVLTEDGMLLPLARTPESLIRGYGAGRYGIENGSLLFSASDLSDVRTNGRAYRLRWPTPIPPWARNGAYGAALAGLFFLIESNRSRLLRFASGRGALWSGLTVLLAAALATRLPFYLLYAIPGVAPDTPSYVRVLMQLEQGHVPLFDYRTAGYPLFLAAVHLISDRTAAVMVAQSMLSVGGFCLLLYAVHRIWPILTLPVALLLAGVSSLGEYLAYETTILSDSLFSSGVVLALASLLLGLRLRSARWLAAAATIMALDILVRPAGLFFVGIYLLVLAFLLWNRYPRRAVLAHGVPFAILLTGAALYNAATIGRFTLTTLGAQALGGATVTFWEPSPDFSTDVNAMITGPPSYPKEDLRVIRESWNLDRVYQAFYRNYGLGRKSGWLPIWARTATGRTVLDSVIRHAIHEHPDRYAKFVLSMAKQFFFRNITHDVDPYEKVSRRNYMSLMGRQHHLRKLRRLPPHPFVDQMRKAYGEFFDKSASNLEEIPTGNTRRLRPIYRSATKPHQILLSAGTHLFRHVAWVVMSLGTFLAAVVVLARRRGRDVRAFFVMLLGAVAIAAGLLTCLGELAFPRFNLPVAFIFFLAPFPLPGLWLGHGIDAAAAPPANERPDPR